MLDRGAGATIRLAGPFCRWATRPCRRHRPGNRRSWSRRERRIGHGWRRAGVFTGGSLGGSRLGYRPPAESKEVFGRDRDAVRAAGSDTKASTEIRDQVPRDVDADGQTHQARRNAQARRSLGQQALVGGGRRVGDDGFARQDCWRSGHPHAVHRGEGGSLPPRSTATTGAPGPVHLAHGKVVLRVVGQAGIDEAGQPRIALRARASWLSAVGLGAHAQVQRVQPAQHRARRGGLIAPPACFPNGARPPKSIEMAGAADDPPGSARCRR